ncbi:MAG TPA: replication protein RepA [Isosphaeraceae bacterium]|nr:replication protein RepA [Isosphaeraceae bacterium]
MKLDLDRREVEAAAAYMANEDSGIGYLFSGWCQAGLPHKRLADTEGWQIETEGVILIVEPGMRPGSSGKPESVGVPYGSRARLIMLYLQSEALQTGRREVELGRSLRVWLARMGIPQGGKSIAGVKEQAERISRCKLSFNIALPGLRARGMRQQAIVDSAIFLEPSGSETQGTLFTETATLSQGFFEHLQKHPVPLEEAAIRAINNNSMALDVYAWLAYRLHALTCPRPVSWVALKKQFGNGFNRMDNFRAKFTENLRLAMAVYPAAKVEGTDRGLLLHPSRPPVLPRSSSVTARVPRAG